MMSSQNIGENMVLLLISGIYAIVLGLGIIGLWIMLLATKQVPELKTEKIEIIFHITAESVMGILSLVSGILLLLNLNWAVYLFIMAMGLVTYAVINSVGYYAQKKELAFVIMFAVILVASITLVILNIIKI